MISKQRIDNHVKGLKTLQSVSIRNNNYISGEDIKKICKEYKMSRDILTRAVEFNYVKKLDISKYKFILQEIQPIHARKIIERQSEIVKTSTLKNKSKNNTKSSNINPSKKLEVPNKKEKPIVKQTEKRFSILWGLFTFTSKN